MINLEKYNIKGTKEIVYNPSYDFLYEEELSDKLEGYEKGQLTELGAVNVMTGIFTGRSPKDKYLVVDENSKDTVWWTSPEYPNDNHPMRYGKRSRSWQPGNSATRDCLSLMLSVALTRIPEWL